jgi:hypothetical protein
MGDDVSSIGNGSGVRNNIQMLRVQMRGALGTNTVPGRGNPDPVRPEHVGFRHFSASHGREFDRRCKHALWSLFWR